MSERIRSTFRLKASFLSAEAAQVLTIVDFRRDELSPFLWPSNGKQALTYSFGIWLKAGREGRNQNRKPTLDFSLFPAPVDADCHPNWCSKLTAAKLMVGKSIQQSDETYIAKAQLKDAFIKLQKYLTVTGVIILEVES